MLPNLNRLAALFLKTYPGYTRETMLEEYAITVITLINEAVKLDAADKLADIQATSMPYMSKSDANSVMNHYKRILEETQVVDNEQSINKLKDLLR